MPNEIKTTDMAAPTATVSFAELEANAKAEREELLAQMEADRAAILEGDPNANNNELGSMRAELEKQRWEADNAKYEEELAANMTTSTAMEMDKADESAPSTVADNPMKMPPQKTPSTIKADVSSPSTTVSDASSPTSSAPAAPSSGASGSGGTGGE